MIFFAPGERRRALVEDPRLGEEGDEVVAELGAQRLAPAVVLLEPPVEALPAGGGERRASRPPSR